MLILLEKKHKGLYHTRTDHSFTLCLTSALDGFVWTFTPLPIYPHQDSAPIIRKVGWPPGPAWTGVENLAPTGIRSPDRPTLSDSLF